MKTFFRSLTFTKQLKQVFLEGLSAQVRAGLTPQEVFEFTLENTDDIALRALSEISLASSLVGKPFSRDYVEEGFFTVWEAALLEVAEAHNAIPEIVEFIMQEEDQSQDFWGVVVVGNLSWIGSFVGLIVLMMLSVEYEDVFSFGIGSRASLFVYGDWLWTNIGGLCLVTIGIITCYLFARSQLNAKQRSNARWLGFAAAADNRFMIGLSQLFCLLFEKGVPQNGSLGVAVKVYDVGGFAARSLRDAEEDAQGDALFVQSCRDHIFGPTLGLQLELLAGRASLPELASAFDSLTGILKKANARLLKKLKLALGLVLGLLVIALSIPLIEFAVGGNLAGSGV